MLNFLAGPKTDILASTGGEWQSLWQGAAVLVVGLKTRTYDPPLRQATFNIILTIPSPPGFGSVGNIAYLRKLKKLQ